MRGTFGRLDSRQKELMRLAVIETLCAHFVSPPFFDPRSAAERTRPLDGATLDTVGRFVQSVNFSALDAVDVSSNEMRRFLEALMMRFLDVNPAFKHPRYSRYVPALRARAPRQAADVHRGLLASLDGKAPGYGAAPRKRSWTEGRERARKIAQEEYERTTRILEAAMIRSRIDDYTDTGFVPQVEPAEVARRPAPASAPIPAKPAQDTGYQPSATAGDLTVPVSATGFAAAFNAMGITETGVPPAVLRPPLQQTASNQPAGPQLAAPAVSRNGSTGPRELPSDLYDLYGDYLQDMQPDTAVHPALSARQVGSPPTAPHHPQGQPAMPGNIAPNARPWQSASSVPPMPPAAPQRPPQMPQMPQLPQLPQMPPMASPMPPQPNGSAASPSSHADQMVFWQLRYQLEAYVRRAAESYGLSYNQADPSTVLDALRQSGFVDEADLRIAEGILALTDRVTRASHITVEDYRQAFLLYLLYHRSHLGI